MPFSRVEASGHELTMHSDRPDFVASESASAVLLLTGCATAQPLGLRGDKSASLLFRPGDVWLDTSGKPIQAHAGSIIRVGELFYWYGENKEFTTGQSDIESWGIRFYSSPDLYNWTDLGPLIAPVENDPKSPLR